MGYGNLTIENKYAMSAIARICYRKEEWADFDLYYLLMLDASIQDALKKVYKGDLYKAYRLRFDEPDRGE